MSVTATEAREIEEMFSGHPVELECSLCCAPLDFPDPEAFDLERVICCADCAEEIIQSHSQFGVGA